MICVDVEEEAAEVTSLKSRNYKHTSRPFHSKASLPPADLGIKLESIYSSLSYLGIVEGC
jgi:hypothetical protein